MQTKTVMIILLMMHPSLYNSGVIPTGLLLSVQI